MKHLLLAFTVLFATLTGPAAWSQTSTLEGDPNFKVGFVRMDKILEKSERVAKKVERLKTEYRGLSNDLEEKAKALQKQGQDLESRRGLMAPDQADREFAAFKAKADQFNENRKLRESEMERKKRALLEPEIDWLWENINRIGKEKNFDIIFDEADVAYGAKDFDISDIVLADFDRNPPPTPAPGAATPAPKAEAAPEAGGAQ